MRIYILWVSITDGIRQRRILLFGTSVSSFSRRDRTRNSISYSHIKHTYVAAVKKFRLIDSTAIPHYSFFLPSTRNLFLRRVDTYDVRNPLNISNDFLASSNGLVIIVARWERGRRKVLSSSLRGVDIRRRRLRRRRLDEDPGRDPPSRIVGDVGGCYKEPPVIWIEQSSKASRVKCPLINSDSYYVR